MTPAGLLLVALLAPAAARAPARPDATEQALRAQAYVDLGTSLFKKKSYEAALIEFQRAEPLVPQATTRAIVRYNIARCLDELRRPEEAVVALDRYLELPDDASIQAAARAKRATLLQQAFGSLVVESRPTDAVCRLTRLRPPPTPATPALCPTRPTPVLAGTYRLELGTREGPTRTARQDVELAVGQKARATPALPAWLRVEVQGAGAEALTIRVDSRDQGSAPLAEGRVSEGPHTLAVLGAEGTVWRGDAILEPGELKHVLVPLDAGLPAYGRSTSRGPGPWPWLTGGGALAAAVGASVFYLRAQHELAQSESALTAMQAASTRARYDAARESVKRHDDSARSGGAWALGLGLTGAALVGVTTWLFLRGAGSRSTTGLTASGRSDNAPLEVRF